MRSRDLVEQALARIADPAGEGQRAFIRVYPERARAEADRSDALRAQGIVRSPIEGLPVSIKDLFDVAGDVTRAGSKIRADAATATRDAGAVARLRAAGAVIVGRTNMVEFAFGAVGANPHYGTPRNPFDRATGRIPGGSSSGAAVAVADGMCAMGLGSDTRGSIRIPAALCGLTGFKPTARRVPRDGAFPLSYTLDSVGPIAQSVSTCAMFDAVLADETPAPLQSLPLAGARLLLPRSSVLADLDHDVEAEFHRALGALARGGAAIVEVAMPMFDRQAEYFRAGGFSAIEAYAIHKPTLARLGEYDPRVGKRIVLGEQLGPADYAELGRLRAEFIREVEAAAAQHDAILMPTTPCSAPTIAECTQDDESYFRWNARLLRDTGLVNFLDGCAVSLPCHAPGAAPVGLSVCGVAMSDRRTLAVAQAIERALAER
jgi:aspartyl-tRNA(Asn)/glutamyl-tRNA(Gln) amidotransferase subunit A